MIFVQKFWTPALTSQFPVCPIPFHLDTYRGCQYNCRYCFARDPITFTRRNTDNKSFTYVEGNRPEKIRAWLDKTIKKTKLNYHKGEEIAIKETIPLKIGANADPFPPIEKSLKITYKILKAFHKYDYPIQIQTKNPSMLVDCIKDFENPNWAVSVTLITLDEKFCKICEPNAPTPKERLDCIKELTNKGIKVMVKIQPCIYPKILEDLPELIKGIKNAGVWAFNTEGLKIRKSMPLGEQKIIQVIGDYLNINLREFYKSEDNLASTDYELSKNKKLEYIRLAEDLAKKYGLKYFVADNDDFGCMGAGCECCGTEVLHNYKIFGDNRRSLKFGVKGNVSNELGKCYLNFCRNMSKSMTINEYMKKHKGGKTK
ncbi:MAG: radical SAM protein [archaeon]